MLSHSTAQGSEFGRQTSQRFLLPAARRVQRRPLLIWAKASAYASRGKVAVIGGGPGGLLAAILLAELDFDIKVFEKRPAPVRGTAGGDQRTIVFGINARGRNALTQAGVSLPCENSAANANNPLTTASRIVRRLADDKGNVQTSPGIDLPPGAIFVERQALVEHLHFEAQRLQPERIELMNGTNVNSLDLPNGSLEYSNGKGPSQEQFDLIVGADGKNSQVRSAMQADPSMTVDIVPGPRYYISFAGLPPTGNWTLKDEKGSQVVFCVGPGRKCTMSLWLGGNGNISGLLWADPELFDKCEKENSYPQLISDNFPGLPLQWIPLIARQLQSFQPSSEGASIRCSKLVAPNTVLLGDAASGVLPNMGQGCNSAMESAFVLSQAMKACKGSIPEAIQEYEQQRKPDAHALYQLDLRANARSGAHSTKWWNLEWLNGQVDLFLGLALSKVFPKRFKGPMAFRMFNEEIPFREAYAAFQRTKVLTGVLVAAIVLTAGLQLAPHVVAAGAALSSMVA